MSSTTRASRRAIARRSARLKRLRAAVLLGLVSVGATAAVPATADARPSAAAKPTIVLVHGAWADGSSWSGVTRLLQRDGYRVVAPANPLRSLSGDAAYLRSYLGTVDGPVVLVGHSYGAAVITNAAVGDRNVRALVFVNGSVPAAGETVGALAGPDSALSVPDPTTILDFVPAQLPPTAETDLYLKKSTFLNSFATGLRARDALALWAAQRPITFGALNEPSGVPAWTSIPSWSLIGTKDLVIPPSAQRAMAAKSGAEVATFKAGHLGLITDPKPVAAVVEKAVAATR